MLIFIIGLTSLLLCVDILIKQHIEENMNTGDEKEAASGHLYIRKVYNKGFCLNTLEQYPVLIKGISAALGAVLLICNIIVLSRKGHAVQKAGLSLLTAGAASNIFDRLVRGKVIDYIAFKSKHKKLEGLTFNLADFFIAAGTVILAVSEIRKK